MGRRSTLTNLYIILMDYACIISSTPKDAPWDKKSVTGTASPWEEPPREPNPRHGDRTRPPGNTPRKTTVVEPCSAGACSHLESALRDLKGAIEPCAYRKNPAFSFGVKQCSAGTAPRVFVWGETMQRGDLLAFRRVRWGDLKWGQSNLAYMFWHMHTCSFF